MDRPKAPIKTVMRQRMKVPYYEDLANHIGPEPHGGCGNTMADAWVGESVGGALSSEINAFQVPTLWSGGEGNICHSVIASCGRTWRSLSTLACVDTSCAGIGRSGENPPLKSWNGRIQPTKISWCIEVRLSSLQAWNTKTERKRRVGWRRRKAVRQTQNASRKSDNNIVR